MYLIIFVCKTQGDADQIMDSKFEFVSNFLVRREPKSTKLKIISVDLEKMANEEESVRLPVTHLSFKKLVHEQNLDLISFSEV